MRHGMSPSNLVMSVYPEHQWQPWKFSRAPKNFAKDPELSRSYCEWFAKEHNFTSLEDWYSVRSVDLTINDGTLVE